MKKTGDSIPAERIARNLERVRARIGEAAARSGRDAASIVLVGVTKYSTNEETAALVALGVRDLGESRVQEAEQKVIALSNPPVRWHLIGHLQTNKAFFAAALFQRIHSIDSTRLASELEKSGVKIQRKMADGFAKRGFDAPHFSVNGLIEINAAREVSKFGLPPEKSALTELLKHCSEFKHLQITGLMSMAPYAENPEATSRPVFKRVRELLDEANAANVYAQPMTELSMGMTQDFEIAIEEGATLVRVGTALFE
ncbi:MAG TPA: YggS family pyridoxal phosphate-dependent enzyme [Planctomycetota bacterium]|nr:YggS family pyridoxal phosphate-dependent enzyme [Planctomycetota bacterium]